MKVSIVTVSYNQAAYLEKALLSVLNQDYPNIEYVVVDPGSTDGSQEIIEKYRPLINTIVFEPDHGPADGLNKGFSLATGDFFGFLNSDDILFPGVITRVVQFFENHKHIDIVSADADLIDENGVLLCKLYSDRFSLTRNAYGASIIAQQSTFFRSSRYHLVGGFNPRNHCAWDEELFVDMALTGGKFAVVRERWSSFRSHRESISTSKRYHRDYHAHKQRLFRKIMKRRYRASDTFFAWYYRAVKHILNPRGAMQGLIWRFASFRQFVKKEAFNR